MSVLFFMGIVNMDSYGGFTAFDYDDNLRKYIKIVAQNYRYNIEVPDFTFE